MGLVSESHQFVHSPMQGKLAVGVAVLYPLGGIDVVLVHGWDPLLGLCVQRDRPSRRGGAAVVESGEHPADFRAMALPQRIEHLRESCERVRERLYCHLTVDTESQMIFTHILHSNLDVQEPLMPLRHRLGSPDSAGAKGTTRTVSPSLERVILADFLADPS